MTGPRVDYATVIRPNLLYPPSALTAIEGVCSRCGQTVDVGEDVVCVGRQVVVQPDGAMEVDLSGAEWVHARCWTVREAA